jgi:hypothetical protein
MNEITSGMLRVAGDAMQDSWWLVAVAGVIVAGAWLGRRLARRIASRYPP